MTHRHPLPARRLSRLVLMLAWLATGPAYAEQHAPPPPDPEKQAFEKILEARGSARAKRYPAALTQLDDAVALAEGLGDRLPLALALHNAAEVQLLKGEPVDALKAYHRALEVYTQMGHEAGAGMVRERIDALSRLLSKPKEPAVPDPKKVAPGSAEEPLSAIDQAIARVRQRQRSRDQEALEAAETGPVRVTRSEPLTADDSGEWEYVESVRQKIRGNSRYPGFARRMGQEGTVELAFAVQRNGDVQNAEVVKSSGFVVLDVEALRNVRESAPYDAVPDGAGSEPLTVRLTFIYKLPVPSDGAP